MPYQTRPNRFSIEFAHAGLGLVTARRPEELFVSTQQNTKIATGIAAYNGLECSELTNLKFLKQDAKFLAIIARGGLVNYQINTQLSTLTGTDVNITSLTGIKVNDHTNIFATTDLNKAYALDTSTSPASWLFVADCKSNASVVPLGLINGDSIGEDALYIQEPGEPGHLYRPNATISRLYHVAYDITGYMTDGITKHTETGMVPLNGTYLEVGNDVTLPTWCYHSTSIDSIPIRTLEARLKSVGSPTGNMTAKIYEGTTLIATSKAIDVTKVTSTWSTFTFVFNTTTNRKPGVAYKETIAFTGTATDYIVLAFDVSNTGLCAYTTSWSTLAGGGLVATTPGIAPTATSAVGYLGRIFTADRAGRRGFLGYSNVLDPCDWSAPAATSTDLPSAGSLSIGQAAKAIKALVPLKENLYIFKGSGVYRLKGNNPGNYSLSKVMEGINATGQAAACNAGNTALVHSDKGLVGFTVDTDTNGLVEALRSSQVNNRIKYTTHMAYLPIEQQVHLFSSSMDAVFVYDVGLNAWSKYEYKTIPSVTVQLNGVIYSAEKKTGRLLTYQDGISTDDRKDFELTLSAASADMGDSFSSKLIDSLTVEAHCLLGGVGTISFTRDTGNLANFSRKLSIPVNADTTVGDLYGILVSDLYGIAVGGSDYAGLYIFNDNLATGNYAGIDLTQFAYSSDGPKQLANNYLVNYPVHRVQVTLKITRFLKNFRLNSIALHGRYIGRRIN